MLDEILQWAFAIIVFALVGSMLLNAIWWLTNLVMRVTP